MFDVHTVPEQGWPVGVVYEQHTVAVVIMARTKAEITAFLPQIDAAIQAITGYLRDEDRGDAGYEADADVYAYFTNYVIRQRRS